MSRSDPRSPRRGRTAVSLAAVALVLAGGGTLYRVWPANSTAGSPTDSAQDNPLTVRYRTDGAATVPVGRPWLEVINNADAPVSLRDVTLRYYFSADDGAAYSANCVQSALRCSSITQTIAAAPAPLPTASHYLQVGFTEAAGSLAPGETSQGIGLQLYRLDHRDLDQSDDHSFDGSITSYAPSPLVTAYRDGVLSWGREPGSPTASAPLPPFPAVAAEPGVLFDNFHYTGVDDPALTANGWQPRTDGGGPGISGSWSTDAISFPADPQAQGGQALQLQVVTDGTRQGTRQSELAGNSFFTGTLAARIHFTDRPDRGRNGDHINESFATISPTASSPRYSELDFEYQPNGGWGVPGPKLDTTSWRSAKPRDRATHALHRRLDGWHIVMLTVADGKVTYSVDGRQVFRSDGRTFPREAMRIHLSTWLVDLPFAGDRTWSMRVDWVYSQAGKAVTAAGVKQAVNRLSAAGVNHLDTTDR
ncbi:cellulose binding domain-containing protein [Catellatospora paridis]|uniref:cellulose binding domain-containing protein n=1 Tax=Catellatospora paridis TaxID=1617086 RepID=UPI001E38CE2C|nr:cellulose binding domain-containing protein [Catellatospora paridis]